VSAAAPLTPAELSAAGRDLPAQLAVELGDGASLTVGPVLRLLPGKRLAGPALLGDGQVFAKLYFSSGAARHGVREKRGIQALLAAGLPSPALIHAEPWSCGGYAVVTAHLPDALPLDEGACDADLLATFALFGRLHRAGLIHRDAHLGNVLKSGGQFWLIDGDGIVPAGENERLDNLALLAAQMPARWPDLAERALAAYGSPVATDDLARRIARAEARRLSAFLAKTVRECSEFCVSRNWEGVTVVRRDRAARLAGLLADPDAALAGGIMLKDGGTCTVVRIDLEGLPVAVKRYNLKNTRHALSRAWRPSRAWQSWIEAQRLSYYGIPTPRPLAVVERRFGPLRGRAYLVTVASEGRSLLDAWSADVLPPEDERTALLALLAALRRFRIGHGDLKASNFLIADGRVELIDLDATCQHRSEWRYRRAWQRDRARLLANWPAGSPLHTWLDDALPRE
jgi:tRNA A-37 threonylcarbamoyl transferase component Bud32